MSLDKIRLRTSINIYCDDKGIARPNPSGKEHRFHPTRRWRFDYCWPELMIAVEYEGLTGGSGGRHQRRGGYTEDSIKYTEAILLGWTLIRLTSETTNNLWGWLDRAIELRRKIAAKEGE